MLHLSHLGSCGAVMNNDQMRELARQYRAKAEAANNPQARATLTETAEIWETLAGHYDNLGFWGRSALDRQTSKKDPSEGAS